MYQVNIKVQKEKSVYLVGADNPTVVEAAITDRLAHLLVDEFKLTAMKEAKFDDIILNDGSNYYHFVIESEGEDRTIKENILVKDESSDSAWKCVLEAYPHSEIVKFTKTDILNILN